MYGAVASLARMEVDLGGQGRMSLDASTFHSQSVQAIEGFLGGLSTGGLLQAANNALNSVRDSTSGALTSAIGSNASNITNQNNLISANHRKISPLQTNLTQQIAAPTIS
jgi:hypothetical protein